MSDSDMRQLFNQLDINRDGEINYEEFLTGLRDKRTTNSKAGRLLSNNVASVGNLNRSSS